MFFSFTIFFFLFMAVRSADCARRWQCQNGEPSPETRTSDIIIPHEEIKFSFVTWGHSKNCFFLEFFHLVTSFGCCYNNVFLRCVNFSRSAFVNGSPIFSPCGPSRRTPEPPAPQKWVGDGERGSPENRGKKWRGSTDSRARTKTYKGSKASGEGWWKLPVHVR